MAQNPNIEQIILKNGIKSMILTNPTNYSSMCELPNNKFIATSANNIYEIDLETKGISLYDNHNGPNGHSSKITCCCLLGNNKFLITGSTDNTIRAWEIKSGNCKKVLTGHTNSITCIVPYKNGQIISGSVDTTIKIWDVASKQCIKTLDGEYMIGSICVTENYILGGNSDGLIIIWDNKTYAEHGTITINESITSIIQLNESHIICANDNNIITIWNIDTRDRVQELKGHLGPVRDLSLLHDGSNRLVSISIGIIRIWDLNTYESDDTLKYLSSGSKIEALENGWIASIHENTIRFWNPDEFPLPLGPTFNENGESLDKDGSVLSNCAICWNIINPNKNISRLNCGGIFHKSCIKDMSYCPICNKIIVNTL